MSLSRKTLGKHGEALALKFLRKKGYKILSKNYQNYLGEIDIIALDNGDLAFIEVKTRKTKAYGTPFEAVHKVKREKLRRVARAYLQKEQLEDKACRFDVIGIEIKDNDNPKIELIKNVF